MKKKKLTKSEREMMMHEQRFTMVIILCNLLEAENGVSIHIKSATAASLLNMMESSMSDEDETLKAIIDNAIDGFCYQVEMTHDIENYRDRLVDSVKQAKKTAAEIKEKIERIRIGDEILKSISLN